MKNRYFDTLTEAIQTLNREGYTASLKAENGHIIDLGHNRKYKPDRLVIQGSYRFEGQTNPADSVEVFAIKAKDQMKGTLVMSYGAKHSQDAGLIRRIPFE